MISPTLRRILESRGYTTDDQIQSFLNPDYSLHLHDPLLLPDMKKAIKRIEQAIKDGEQIVIYGDYDIDGLTATSLLLDALTQCGAKVTGYIPDRFEEGYGINTQALKEIKKQGAGLVISVDCGSTSLEPLAWAAKNGLDVIVTDHHEVGPVLPEAVAVINPKRKDSKYPFSDLAGVGMAFKLVQGLQKETKLLPKGQEKWLLDLVALGTVCDVVSLVDENRVLVTYGLKVFAKTRRVGLRCLTEVAKVELGDIDTYHFGFILGPRLNAAGRLEHAKYALDLFTATDHLKASKAANYLDELNYERRQQQAKILEGALKQAEQYSDDAILVLSDLEWSHGIVGIVAAKIMEQFHKPTIILQEMGEESKGSARSLNGFSMVEAMHACKEHLTKYGGHHVAAGCTLKTADIPAFRKALNDHCKQIKFKPSKPELNPDLILKGFNDLTWETYQDLQKLAPFGQGNRRPLLGVTGVEVTQHRVVGGDQRHLKLSLADTAKVPFEAIGFNLASKADKLTGSIDVQFELDVNEYQGKKTLQLSIKDIV